MDHHLCDFTDDQELATAHLEKDNIMRLLDKSVMKKKILPSMLEKALVLAGEKMKEITAPAMVAMTSQLQDEIERLKDLRQLNDHIRPDEINAAKNQKSELESALATARIRLDSVRLILRVP